MKKLLLLSLLVPIALVSCKKDKSAKPAFVTPITTLPDQTNGKITISSIVPSSGLPNTVVTINGTNFGSSAAGMRILFNGLEATIQSVAPTEIKVLVPITTTGSVDMILGNQYTTGPVFTYISPELNAAYVGGDVTLRNQAEINTFVALNKGKQLQLTGNLNLGAPNFVVDQANDITSLTGLSIISAVSGTIFLNKIKVNEAPFLSKLTAAGGIGIYSSNFTTLNFDQLQSFFGSLTLSDLAQLTGVKINLASNMKNISISACPLLTDFSFISNISVANQISLSSTGAATINLDNLTSVNSMLIFSGNKNLSSISAKALATAASITVAYSPLLTQIEFKNLASVTGKLTVRNIGVSNMTSFSALQSLGSLLIDDNQELTSLQGLEQLTRLTSEAVIKNTIAGPSPLGRVNGVYISNNAKLTSLSGLQNVTTPIAYITDNKVLNDLCPFKNAINQLSKLPSYSFTYKDQIDEYRTGSFAALTLTKNGNFDTKQAALDAVTVCK